MGKDGQGREEGYVIDYARIWVCAKASVLS